MDPKLVITGPPVRFRQKNNPVEAQKYDFRAARTQLKSPNSIVDSVTHMLMCALGSGLVALHVAYMECGIWTALGLNVVLSCCAGYCLCILVWTAQKMYGRLQVPQLIYPDLVEAVVLLSPWPILRRTAKCFRYAIELTIMCHLYGSCCVFVIMIARNLKELVEGNQTLYDGGNPSLTVYILSLMVPFVLVCIVTGLKYLAPFALIADLYAVGLVLVIMWYTFKRVQISPMDRPGFKSIMGLFEFVGVCVFILGTTCIALPIENNMDQPKKFHYVVFATMPILTCMMITIGFFGYWHYGETAVAPITIHFPFSPFPIQLKVFLCLVLYVTFSICFYLAFDIEWAYIKRLHSLANYWFWERLYRIIHMVIIILISYKIPHVTRMMGILGSFCTSSILFIFPPFLELLVDWQHPGLGRYKWRLWKFIGLIVFGLVVFGGGTFYNVCGLVLEKLEPKDYRKHVSVTAVDVVDNGEDLLDDNETFFGNDTFFRNETF